VCDNRRVVPSRWIRATVLLALLATPLAGWSAQTLPPEVPPATRARLAPVTDQASLATRVDGPPFEARRDVFEYLLDHPDFATHVTRVLRAARYRVWAVPGGYGLDDGWGTVGTFQIVYAGPGIRVMHLKGEYQQRLLPDIRGEVIVTVSYATTPAGHGKSTIAAAVGSFVKLDNPMLRAAGWLASSVARAKAEKEGVRLVKTFARTTRGVEDNPAVVLDGLQQRPDVPRRELEEFRRLVSRPPASARR
jgi:hypothetical protein